MSSKLHMTVPREFRRNSRIPEILVLHRAHLDTGEVQETLGIRVTRPLRTIVDLLRCGHVERGQLKLVVVDEAIRRGLIGRREIDRMPDDKLQRSFRELARQPAYWTERNSTRQPAPFRAALETRLQTRAREQGTGLQRLRRQVAFDRFLARVFSNGPKATYPGVLKGGCGMELRMHSAPTTKDMDLTLHHGTRLSRDPTERGEQVRAMLQEAAETRLFRIPHRRSQRGSGQRAGRRQPVSRPSTNGWTRLCALSRRRRCRGRSARLWRSSPAKTGLASGA